MPPERRGGPPPESTRDALPKKEMFDWEHGEIPESEVRYLSSRGGDPGGQSVNTTDSRVELRWNIQNSSSLSDEQKSLLRTYARKKAKKKLVEKDGEIKFVCASERSQVQNRHDCLNRLNAFLRKALTPEEERIATRKSKGVKAGERRASEADKRRKAGRGPVTTWE